MESYLQSLLDFATQHQALAILLAFAIAALEAVFVIGLFVPSTIVLVGIGGLIGMGKLPFWPLYFATTLGAIAGDALSYWIGHRYREQLFNIWPFSRYRALLESGQRYFERHGGKSVVIGRFIPGIKAVVPGIAGMMLMNPTRFAVLNVLSAFVWAAAHLLPGMSAGWMLASLGGISRRLAMAALVVLLLVALLVWLLHKGISLGWYYREHILRSPWAGRVMIAAGLLAVLPLIWSVGQLRDLLHSMRNSPSLIPVEMASMWKSGGWADLPAYRHDIGGKREEPFLLQWQGTPEQLQASLLGWTPALTWTVTHMNGFAAGNTPVEALPVLPKLNAGHKQRHTWVKAEGQGRYVLRLYPQVTLEPNGAGPVIWLGSVTFESVYRPLGQLSLPFTDDDKGCSGAFLADLPQAVGVGDVLPGAPKYDGCGGRRVLAVAG